MTESVEEHREPVRTGVAAVDDVIAATEALAQRPLDEHIGVFESAHEQLRSALDATDDESA